MASFLARTAGLGGNPPVANALTAVNATNAASAANAVKLQGYGANDFARVAVATQGADKSTTLGNWLSVADVSVTAPGPGYVLVSGTVTEYVTGGTNYVSSQLYSSATQQASPRTLGYMPDGHRLSLSQSYVFPVAAAGQYTFQLRFKAGGGW